MNNQQNKRKGIIHLYNPKREGLGSYDINYINASKKYKQMMNKQKTNKNERYAA